MEKQMIGMCGAYCGVCEWRPRTRCLGCQTAEGRMYWGECAIAKCCLSKNLAHCGSCPDLPCETLQAAFDHPEHGDRGERLANLQAWARGEDTYQELRPPETTPD
ncbi:DUF3795 domain-containing protein [Candidatus Sumerlaeota bacterium]|nr:DUF3795 domain-containing protein [Candidatus Sumerlaeota bacterium]